MSQDYGILRLTKPGTIVKLVDIVFIMMFLSLFVNGVDCVFFARGDHPGDYTLGSLE